MLHIGQALVGVKNLPLAVLPAAQGGVGGQVFLPGLPGLVEGGQVLPRQPVKDGLGSQGAAGVAPAIDIHLQQHAILQQGGGIRVGGRIAAGTLPAEVPVPGRLLRQGGQWGCPVQLMLRALAAVHVPADEHPGRIVGELFPGHVVLVGTKMEGRRVILAERLLRPGGVGAVIAPDIALQESPGGGGAVLPDPGDVSQGEQVGLYVGSIDDPVFLHAPVQNPAQFPLHEFRRGGQHGDVVGRLQVVEGGVIVDAVGPRLPGPGQGGHPGVVVALAAADHGAVAVVRPDLDDRRGQLQIAVPVELHHLAVQVGCAGRAGVALLHQLILAADKAAHQGAPGGGGVVAWVIHPERPVPLAAEPQVPDHVGALFFQGGDPQRLELGRVFVIAGVQTGVGLAEQLRPQGLGVVVGHGQSHALGQGPVAGGVLAGAGDHHVAAAAQQGLQGHLPGQLAASAGPPGAQQHLIVEEPPPPAHRRRTALPGVAPGHRDALLRGEVLVIPEPEVLHPQQFPANGQKAVEKAPVIPGGHRQGIPGGGQLPAFRRQIRRYQPDLPPGPGSGQADGVQVPAQDVHAVAHRAGGMFCDDPGIAVQFHKGPPYLGRAAKSPRAWTAFWAASAPTSL